MAHHPLTRRKMLELSGIGAIALTVPLGVLESTAAAAQAAGPVALRRSSYLGLIGREFPTDGGATLTLTQVSDLSRSKTDGTLVGHEEAFTLLFNGPASPVLEPAIHTLQHPELGSISLFLAPVEATTGSARHYEVIVDRTIRLASMLDDVPTGGGSTTAAKAGAASIPARLRAASRLRVRASARRHAAVVSTTLNFPGGGVQAVRVKLTRGGHTYARGTGAVRKGHAVLQLKSTRRTPRGGYTLVITATDLSAAATTVERHVTVR